VEQATDEARSAHGASAGTVRISCTAALGVRHVSRLIFAFQGHHPDIAVDLSLTDERVDLIREGVDIALRLGPLADSSMKLRAIGQSRRVLVASPAYLARHGRPMVPGDLKELEGIRMSNIAGSEALALEGPDSTRHVVPFGGRLQIDHGLAAREAFVAARGFGPAHIWLVDDLLAEGRLETILPEYTPPSIPLNMLIAPERASIARVRLMVEFLAEMMLHVPGIEKSRVGR
jgi:DNA-binding transcriptional LysR family regulator